MKRVIAPSGEIVEASEFHVGLWFPSDYCRHADPFHVLTWLYPHNIWHPNIRPPVICVGKITPATDLCDLLYQCYEIITYFNWAPHNGLNLDGFGNPSYGIWSSSSVMTPYFDGRVPVLCFEMSI